MATFDPNTGQLILQIVYDGAAFSGKTASVESLGRILRRPVVSPEIREGRTLFFDWMEYEGGYRFGRPIASRVLSVPGQKELAHRRQRLIREADGIIFVADSRRTEFAQTVERWHALQTEFSSLQLDAALTVQLNHRDCGTALPAKEMRKVLGGSWNGRFFESVATQDSGIREAFVVTVSETLKHHLEEGAVKSTASSLDTQPVRTLSAKELANVLAAGDRADTQPIRELSPAEVEEILSGS